MRLEESTHHDQEITRVAKQVATLLESRLSLRLKRRDGDEWLDALNDRRSRRLKARGGRRVIAVEGLYDARALLEALVWDEVARGLLTAEGRRAADILRQLATKAAHQGPEVRRPEAAEQAFALGQQVLGAAGIPESALGGGRGRGRGHLSAQPSGSTCRSAGFSRPFAPGDAAHVGTGWGRH